MMYEIKWSQYSNKSKITQSAAHKHRKRTKDLAQFACRQNVYGYYKNLENMLKYCFINCRTYNNNVIVDLVKVALFLIQPLLNNLTRLLMFNLQFASN